MQNVPVGLTQLDLTKNLYEVMGMEIKLYVKLDIHMINNMGAVKCFLILGLFKIITIAITLTIVPKRLHNAAPIPPMVEFTVPNKSFSVILMCLKKFSTMRLIVGNRITFDFLVN